LVTDYYQLEKNQKAAREQQELYRTRITIADAVGQDVPVALATKLAAKRQASAIPARSPDALLGIRQGLALVVGFLLASGLAIWKLARATPRFTTANFSTNVRAEESALSEFLAIFRTGPSGPTPSIAPPAVVGSGRVAGESHANDGAVRDFCRRAAIILDTQRQLVQEIDRTLDEAGRQKILTALRWEMHALRIAADLPELLPAWQVAYALEGLLKQLTDNAANVTLSTLRTVASCIDLLADLCLPGLPPDLLARRPLRLLAVDDDPISRKAVSLALKRALNEPDLAKDGKAALALATQQTYDVIFLDVQMPGMDGFEVCTRIHETAANRTTPVVFVTCHSDFDARAKSALSGGSDLIGKPFLTFEITVKALMLALRGRLSALAENARAATTDAAIPSPQPPGGSMETPASSAASTDCVQSSQLFADGGSDAEAATGLEDLAAEFLDRASAHLGPLRETFQAILQTPDETMRQDMLADVFLRIQSFTPKDDLPALHPAIQLSAALDGLLRKLLEDPRKGKVSNLVTLAAGVELLIDLCARREQSDLGTNPPIRMLVVDDDPVARRAVVGALQMAFEKPESAESGTAALALTTAKPYDVIFLDVQMPGMDGFEVCSKIRESGPNRDTPVVFVTGQDGLKARTQMSLSGGSDFVGKPFLTSEITVKALTLALRGRMEKLADAPALTATT